VCAARALLEPSAGNGPIRRRAALKKTPNYAMLIGAVVHSGAFRKVELNAESFSNEDRSH
ncbi:MAG: hypothetical protein WBD60_02405, partial [Methylovirgula sp.]